MQEALSAEDSVAAIAEGLHPPEAVHAPGERPMTGPVRKGERILDMGFD